MSRDQFLSELSQVAEAICSGLYVDAAYKLERAHITLQYLSRYPEPHIPMDFHLEIKAGRIMPVVKRGACEPR